jgi:hypothetical protein
VADDRCPSCGAALGGDTVSTRYKGNLTVIRVEVPPAAEGEDPTYVEHVCGD